MVQQLPLWRQVCAEMAKQLKSKQKPIEIQTLLDILRDHNGLGFTAYTGKADYGNLRLCRLLIHSYGCRFADSRRDFYLLYRCSPHVSRRFDQIGIGENYALAIHVRNGLREIMKNKRYSLSDLTCYLCLIPKEAMP